MLDHLKRIDELGGALRVIDSGFGREVMNRGAQRRQRRLDRGERPWSRSTPGRSSRTCPTPPSGSIRRRRRVSMRGRPGSSRAGQCARCARPGRDRSRLPVGREHGAAGHGGRARLRHGRRDCRTLAPAFRFVRTVIGLLTAIHSRAASRFRSASSNRRRTHRRDTKPLQGSISPVARKRSWADTLPQIT